MYILAILLKAFQSFGYLSFDIEVQEVQIPLRTVPLRQLRFHYFSAVIPLYIALSNICSYQALFENQV